MVPKINLEMRDRTRARVILVALLLTVTIVGIRATGTAGGWVPPASHVMITIGITVEVVLGALLVVVLRRHPPGDLAGRLRAVLSRILGTALFAIPVAFILAILRRPNRSAIFRRLTPPLSARHHHGAHLSFGVGSSAITLTFIRYALIVALIGAAAALIYMAWLRRGSRLPVADVPDDEPIEFPQELARAVRSGRRALAELDDARAAIIGCYLAMEASLAKAGAARRAAETPDELLARAVAGDLVSAEPASRLTALFYEARFSSHPMPQAKRDEAASALAELAETLPRDQPAAVASTRADGAGERAGGPAGGATR
jgi:Domain of unknown function (DUF4129)